MRNFSCGSAVFLLEENKVVKEKRNEFLPLFHIRKHFSKPLSRPSRWGTSATLVVFVAEQVSLSFCLPFRHYLLSGASKGMLLATNTLTVTTTIVLFSWQHWDVIYWNVPYRNIKNRFTLLCLNRLTFPQTSTAHLQNWDRFLKVYTHLKAPTGQQTRQ